MAEPVNERGGRWRAILELLRLPNVFTAVADVAMGYLVTRPAFSSLAPFGWLVASSVLLYWAGMVLNDVCDVQQDTAERPQRPIPSGRISLAAARLLGLQLLLCGMACGWMAAYLADDWRPGYLATLLAVLVVAYDAGLKRTLLGPLAMGSCRLANVLLGMSLAASHPDGAFLGWSTAEWMIAVGIGVYVVGVTWVARTEAQTSDRSQLVAGSAVLLAGLVLLSSLPRWTTIVYSTPQWLLLWGVLVVMIGWRCIRAIVDPTPRLVQAAVKHGVLSIIFLDAAITAGFRGGGAAIAVLLLAIPATYLGRWIYST